MRPLALVLLMLALAGCTDPTGRSPPTEDAEADASASSSPASSGSSSTPAASRGTTTGTASGDSSSAGGSASPCEGGASDVFLATSHGAGAMPDAMRPRLVEITHDGIIRILWGHTEPGNGNVVEDEGAMDGLTLGEAKSMLARRNFTYEELDLVIERGDRAQLPTSAYASFCARVMETLPKVQDAYPPAEGCEYMPTVAWDVSTAAWERTLSVSDCAVESAPGLEEFRALQRDHDRLVGPG